jgi:hypothetical protein
LSYVRVFLFSLIVLSLSLSSATAQTSVYGSAISGGFGFTGDNYPNGPSLKPSTPGFMGGVFHLFPTNGRFVTGVDARGLYSSGYNGGRAYTGAVRFGFVPFRFPLRPFVEFGGGVASTPLNTPVCHGSVCTLSTSRVTGGVVALDGGLDIHVSRRFDLRAFEFGRDQGGSRGTTSAALRYFSGGIVYRLGGGNLSHR